MQEDLDGYCHGQGFGSRQLASWMAARFPELGVEPVLQTSRTSVGVAPRGGTQLESVVDARGGTQLESVVDARGGTQLESVVGLRAASGVAAPSTPHAGAYAPGQLVEPPQEGDVALAFDEDASTQRKTRTGPLLTEGLPTGIDVATVSLRGSGPLPHIEPQDELSIEPTLDKTLVRQLPDVDQRAVSTDPVQKRSRRLWAKLTLVALLLNIVLVILWAMGGDDMGGDDMGGRPQPVVQHSKLPAPGPSPSPPDISDLADRAPRPTALAKREERLDAATPAGRDAGAAAAPVPAPPAVAVRPTLTRRRRRGRGKRHRRRRPKRVKKRRAVKKTREKTPKKTPKRAATQVDAAKTKVPADKSLGDRGARW
jgi:hypothetical protein